MLLYKQYNDDTVAYEVQIIRQVKQFGEVVWANPSNNDWGYSGWTYVNKELAESKFVDI